MDYRVVKISILLLCLLGCNRPYAAFHANDKAIYVCGQDGRSIVTSTSCNQRSENYLLLTWGGFTGGMKLYADFCESYDVTVVGSFDVIGEPEFNSNIIEWGTYVSKRDSIDALDVIYDESNCKFRYSE